MTGSEKKRTLDPAFGGLLRFWREGFGLTQEALSEAVGVSPRHISRLETAQVSPSPQMVERIADALGLTGRDRDLLIYVAGPGVGFASLQAFAEPEPWLTELFNTLLDTINPSPAIVAHVSGHLVAANEAWRTSFGRIDDSAGPNIMVNFWEEVYSSSESSQPKGWAQTRLGLLLSYRQLSILTADRSLETLYETVFRRFPFDEDWIRQAVRISPRPSFPVTTGAGSALKNWTYSSVAIDETGVLSAHQKVWWLHMLLPRDPS